MYDMVKLENYFDHILHAYGSAQPSVSSRVLGAFGFSISPFPMEPGDPNHPRDADVNIERLFL